MTIRMTIRLTDKPTRMINALTVRFFGPLSFSMKNIANPSDTMMASNIREMNNFIRVIP